MNCERSRELAQAYLDGSLAPAERVAFEHHLGACPACRRVVASYRRLFAALAEPAIPEPAGDLAAEPAIPEPAGDLAERALARIRAAAHRRRAAQTLVSAAAVALCGVVASLAWGLPEALLEAIGEFDPLLVASSAIGSLVALGETIADLFKGVGAHLSLPPWIGIGVAALAAVEFALLAWWRLPAGRRQRARVTR